MIPSLANIRKAIYCLNKRLDLLEGGEYSNTVTELSNKVHALESLLDDDALNPTAAIDKFNEIVSFLNSIDNTETLLELLKDEIFDSVVIETPVNATDATLPITTLTCEVGKYYRIDVAVDTLAVILPAMTDLTTVRTVVIYLTAGTTPAVTITSADSKDVLYQDGFEIEAGSTYEINALFNGAAWIVASVKINTSNS